MYTASMRRIQIYIEEELDERLQAEAARTGRSKAALIRECVAARMGEAKSPAEDPLTQLVGAFEGEAEAQIDEVVYGR